MVVWSTKRLLRFLSCSITQPKSNISSQLTFSVSFVPFFKQILSYICALRCFVLQQSLDDFNCGNMSKQNRSTCIGAVNDIVDTYSLSFTWLSPQAVDTNEFEFCSSSNMVWNNVNSLYSTWHFLTTGTLNTQKTTYSYVSSATLFKQLSISIWHNNQFRLPTNKPMQIL